MVTVSRKEFLVNAAILGVGAFGGLSFASKGLKRKLSFSTLGCPDWTFDEILAFASKANYKGIELRGIKREIDLLKVPDFSENNRRQTRAKLKNAGLEIVNLGSSATLHFSPGAERDKNLLQGKQYIDLAQELACPYIRVFPNNFVKEREKSATMDLIAEGLTYLGDYSKKSGVKVLIETHGDLVWTSDLSTLMKQVNHPNVGLVWDFCNMWVVTKESAKHMYESLKPFIYHTHIKDARLVDNKPQYVFLGTGDVPIYDAIELLDKNKFKGFYSFEWEKLWHPELPEPELAIEDYVSAISRKATTKSRNRP